MQGFQNAAKAKQPSKRATGESADPLQDDLTASYALSDDLESSASVAPVADDEAPSAKKEKKKKKKKKDKKQGGRSKSSDAQAVKSGNGQPPNDDDRNGGGRGRDDDDSGVASALDAMVEGQKANKAAKLLGPEDDDLLGMANEAQQGEEQKIEDMAVATATLADQSLRLSNLGDPMGVLQDWLAAIADIALVNAGDSTTQTASVTIGADPLEIELGMALEFDLDDEGNRTIAGTLSAGASVFSLDTFISAHGENSGQAANRFVLGLYALMYEHNVGLLQSLIDRVPGIGGKAFNAATEILQDSLGWVYDALKFIGINLDNSLEFLKDKADLGQVDSAWDWVCDNLLEKVGADDEGRQLKDAFMLNIANRFDLSSLDLMWKIFNVIKSGNPLGFLFDLDKVDNWANNMGNDTISLGATAGIGAEEAGTGGGMSASAGVELSFGSNGAEDINLSAGPIRLEQDLRAQFGDYAMQGAFGLDFDGVAFQGGDLTLTAEGPGEAADQLQFLENVAITAIAMAGEVASAAGDLDMSAVHSVNRSLYNMAEEIQAFIGSYGAFLTDAASEFGFDITDPASLLVPDPGPAAELLDTLESWDAENPAPQATDYKSADAYVAAMTAYTMERSDAMSEAAAYASPLGSSTTADPYSQTEKGTEVASDGQAAAAAASTGKALALGAVIALTLESSLTADGKASIGLKYELVTTGGVEGDKANAKIETRTLLDETPTVTGNIDIPFE